jgi:hypothetical protein
MFGIESLSAVPSELSKVYRMRLQSAVLPKGRKQLRGPIGLFLVREDGAGGSKLAKEIVGSFGYWDARTAHYFDGVFLGWGYDQQPVFIGDAAFNRCVDDLEAKLKWKYEGGAHLILTDFVYNVKSRIGSLDFSRTVPLNITALMEEKKLSQLSNLIEELREPFVNQTKIGDNSILQASDYLAILRARKQFWKYLLHKFGLVLGIIDSVAPYAARDLRKNKSQRTVSA